MLARLPTILECRVREGRNERSAFLPRGAGFLVLVDQGVHNLSLSKRVRSLSAKL